ncbi:MAG: hypothetical protein EBS01_04725 [Verrucomicrobia bacterium]|nr:hypothetical protein [Verrucomicrobiota bacterium]
MVPEDLRGQSWRYLQSRMDTSVRTIVPKSGTKWFRPLPHPTKPDTLLVPHSDGWIRLLDLSTGSMTDLFKLNLSEAFFTDHPLAASPDGKRLAVVRRLQKPSETPLPTLLIEVFGMEGGSPQSVIRFPCHTPAIWEPPAFNRDGSLLLFSSHEGNGVSVFNVDTGTLMWNALVDERTFAGFSEDGKSVYIVAQKAGFSVRTSLTGAVLRSTPEPKLRGWKRMNVASPDWKLLFSVDERSVCRFIQTWDGKVFGNLPLPSGEAFQGDMAYVADQNVLAVLGGKSKGAGLLQILNAETSTGMRSVQVPIETQTNNPEGWIVVAPPNSGLIAAMRGRTMKVFNIPRLQSEKTMPIEHTVECDNFAFLAPPDLVASMFRWDAPTKQWAPTRRGAWTIGVGVLGLNAPAAKENLNSFFGYGRDNPDGRDGVVTADQAGGLVCASVAADDGRSPAVMKLFRVGSDGVSEMPLDYGKRPFGYGHLSPKGDLIWAGDVILETASGKQLRKVERTGTILPDLKDRTPRWVGESHVVEMVLFQQNEQSSLRERGIALWNVEDGQRSASVLAPNARSLTASPDGSQIAEGGSDKKVRIRDGKTLAEQRVLRVHDDAVLAVAWHPSLPLLATASADHRVKVWDLRSDTMENSGCSKRCPTGCIGGTDTLVATHGSIPGAAVNAGLFQSSGEFPHDFRVGLGDVVGLAGVGGQIVKLVSLLVFAVSSLNELPPVRADANGIVVLVALDEREIALCFGRRLAEKDGQEAEGVLACVFGKFGVQDFSRCGEQVGETEQML